MLPAGKPVEDTIEELSNLLSEGDIVIDGGNSFYKDDMRRAEELTSYENLLSVFWVTFILCTFLTNPLLAQKRGDRDLKMNIIYPEDAFMHAGKGGRIIDVTKPPFNAKGDAKTDDTKALIAVYDFVAENLMKDIQW